MSKAALNPRQLRALEPILLWHDQGLLQEFTNVPQQAACRHLLDHMLLLGGWLILAAQAPDAAAAGGKGTYTADQLAALLGENYPLQQQFQAPYGRLAEPVQSYTYALFQRGLHPRHSFRAAHLGNG